MNLWDGCKKIVYIILFAVLLPLSAYVFYGALDTLKYADALQGGLTDRQVPIVVLGTSFLLGMLLLGLFRYAVPKLEAHEKWSVPALFGLIVLLQLLMILGVRTSLRFDHLKVFDTAVSLLRGGTIGETHFGYYFMKYPNNIPLCLFTYVWMKAASFVGIPQGSFMEVAKLVNAVFMDLGLWCAFRLVCRHSSKKTGFYFLLLVLVNPLWYLLTQMYYTSTISLAFSMGAVWLFDRAYRQETLWKKYLDYFLMGVLLAVGYQIRATVIITAAALLIYAVLRLKRLDLSREAFSLLAVIIGAVLVFGVYGKAEQRYAGFDSSETGYPAVHWIMMSAQGDGQYNSADDAYTGSFATKAERTEADLALLKERIREMGPKGLLTLWKNKLRVAFSDGTDDYYSLFRTMRKTSPLQTYINGGRCDYLALYLHGYHGMMMGFLMLALIQRAVKKSRGLLDIFALNICGAYLFYLIWEVDHAYSVPFMLMFLIWAADGMERAQAGLAVVDRKYSKVMDYVYPMVISVSIMVVFWTVRVVHWVNLPVREYAVLQDQESSQDLVLQTEFVQTFRTGKAFDHVDIWVANWDGAANDSVYDLQILDESGNMVAAGEIVGALAPCIDSYVVSFEKVVPDQEQTYRLCVTTRTPDCIFPLDFLYYQTDGWDMYPEGALYAPEEISKVDLAFSVYEER